MTKVEQTDSQGRRISRGSHAAKAQAELDGMHWTERERIERERKHAKIKHVFRPPSKMGAPTKYEEDMPQRVFDMLTDREVIFTKNLIAAHLGISKETLLEWCADVNKRDLSYAVAQGLAVQEAWLASQMADGMKYSASMYAVLKNLHEWKETVENTHKLSPAEALRLQEAGAKRVDWDRVKPDPLAAQREARQLGVIDVQPKAQIPTHTDAPTPPEAGATHAQADSIK